MKTIPKMPKSLENKAFCFVLLISRQMQVFLREKDFNLQLGY